MASVDDARRTKNISHIQFNPTAPIEGSGTHRVCSNCDNEDEIRPGLAPNPNRRSINAVRRRNANLAVWQLFLTSPIDSLTQKQVEETEEQDGDMDIPIANLARCPRRMPDLQNSSNRQARREPLTRRSKPVKFSELEGENDLRWSSASDSDDSEFNDGDYESDGGPSDDSQRGENPPYAWVEVEVRAENVTIEIEDLDTYCNSILCQESL